MTPFKVLGASIMLVAARPCVLSAAPDFQWMQQGGGTGTDYGTHVAIDSARNTFVVGANNSSTASLGGITFTNDGSFLVKYTASGNPLWAKHFKRLTNQGVGVDAAGNCYMAGNFYGVVDLDGVSVTNNSVGFTDFLVAKYTSNGVLVWVIKAGQSVTSNDVNQKCIAVDAVGGCYLAGIYGTTGNVGTNVLSHNGSGTFAAKCDSMGNWLWAKDLVTSPNLGSPTFPYSIALGTASGFYVCGYFRSPTVTFGSITLTNAGGLDSFLIKCDFAGNVLWGKQAGTGDSDSSHGLATDALDACYVLGVANANSGSLHRPAVSFDDCVLANARFFLVKYDSNGNVVWCRNPADFVGQKYWVAPQGVFDIAADQASNLYLAGRFFGTIGFDGISLTKVGDAASFIAKYDGDGNALWAKQFGGGLEDYTVNDYQMGITVDAAGDCAVTGFFSVTNAPFDSFVLSTAGGEDMFIGQIPADPPRLNCFPIGGGIGVSWPTNQPGFVLEHNSDLTATNDWPAVTNAPEIVGINYVVTNHITGDSQFFRLRK